MLLLAVPVALVALAVLVVVFHHRTPPPATLVEALAREDLPRAFAPQFSFQSKFRPCTVRRSRGQIPSADCAGSVRIEVDERLRSLQRRIAATADSGMPDGIHAKALLDLEWDAAATSDVSRVIERLNGLANSGDTSPEVLADLSAALLVRAGRKQMVGDLWQALDMAELSLQREPTLRAALFNRALALEAVTLGSVATDAWKAYLEVDSTGGWAEEARRRVRTLGTASGQMADPQATDSALAAFAAASRLKARELGQGKLLGMWGEAILRNEPVAAEAALHQAEVIGRTLQQLGGDASLADAVKAIRVHAGDRDEVRKLASAHRWFSAGREAFRTLDYVTADGCFANVYREKPDSRPLIALTQITNAASHRSVDSAGAVQMLQSALVDLDTLRYPALAGKAHFTLGTFRSKANHFATASESYESALPLLERSGEEETTAALLSVYAEADRALGHRAEAYDKAYAAVSALHRYGDLQPLHVALANLSRWLAEDGYTSAALRVNDEDVAVAQRSGVDLLVVEARDNRAEGLARQDETQAALAEVAAAEPLVDSLDTRAREYFSAMLGATRGLINVKQDPREAEAQLSAALRFMRAPAAGVPLRLVTVLLGRAKARLALGQTDSAAADTHKALELIAEAARQPGALGLNRELTLDVRFTLNAVVARLAMEGRDDEALMLLERGVAALGHRTAVALPERAPAGRVVLRYALVGDTVLAWALSSRGLAFAATAQPARELASRVARARMALRQRDDETAGDELARLYEVLIRPIATDLGAPGSTIVVVPDGVLAGVPFSALFDRRTGRYLVEDHLVRRAATLAQATEPLARGTGLRTAAVVEDPAFDPQLFPHLGRLPGARRETPFVAGWAASAPLVLAGASARADTLRRVLSTVAVLHFAGHAISDEDYPDSSFLVLARGSGVGDSGRLTAAEIAGMRLGGLDLVVLSACQTLNDSRGGAGGFTGLGGAFLNAGARGVIGSLWNVDDVKTSALMKRFYLEYQTHPDAAVALRRAQLDMLQRGSEGEKSPAAWAGFEYAGR